MVLFPAPKGSGVDGSYSYPCISPWREQQYDQCDQVEEERGRAPNLSDEQEYGFPLRLDTGRDAARSKVVWVSYLVRRIGFLSVPLELACLIA
jgi:hypothetical protein